MVMNGRGKSPYIILGDFDLGLGDNCTACPFRQGRQVYCCDTPAAMPEQTMPRRTAGDVSDQLDCKRIYVIWYCHALALICCNDRLKLDVPFDGLTAVLMKGTDGCADLRIGVRHNVLS